MKWHYLPPGSLREFISDLTQRNVPREHRKSKNSQCSQVFLDFDYRATLLEMVSRTQIHYYYAILVNIS